MDVQNFVELSKLISWQPNGGKNIGKWLRGYRHNLKLGKISSDEESVILLERFIKILTILSENSFYRDCLKIGKTKTLNLLNALDEKQAKPSDGEIIAMLEDLFPEKPQKTKRKKLKKAKVIYNPAPPKKPSIGYDTEPPWMINSDFRRFRN